MPLLELPPKKNKVLWLHKYGTPSLNDELVTSGVHNTEVLTELHPSHTQPDPLPNSSLRKGSEDTAKNDLCKWNLVGVSKNRVNRE